MIVPSFADSKKLDEYFIIGRNMWPDLKELKNLEFREFYVILTPNALNDQTQPNHKHTNHIPNP